MNGTNIFLIALNVLMAAELSSLKIGKICFCKPENITIKYL